MAQSHLYWNCDGRLLQTLRFNFIDSYFQGSLESWLLLRSLRTLHLRVPRQSQTATDLAEWFDQLSKVPAGKSWDGVPGGLILRVHHSKLQAKTASWDIAKQMEGGWNATFSILVSNDTISKVKCAAHSIGFSIAHEQGTCSTSP